MHGDFCIHDMIFLAMAAAGPVMYCWRCLKFFICGESNQHEGAEPSHDHELGGEG